MKPQSADEVAMVSLMANAVPELYTNPGLSGIARRYYENVGAFEAGLGR